MKILVTGMNGQAGHDVMLELAARGHQVLGSGTKEQYTGVADAAASLPYVQLDITEPAAVDNVIEEFRPEAVIHCAAWTAVDAAEKPENRAQVMAVNADGTRNLARACRKIGAKLLYLSTDYVFDGRGTTPWTPEKTDYQPVNVYGQSKLLGEQALQEELENFFIVRIAWVFGLNGGNFVKTMLKVGKTHDTLRVVNDQIGTPTYTKDLARLLAEMITTDKYGIYHATNSGGYLSWYDFAVEIFRQAGYPTQVLPVTTEEYGLSKAARPKNSRLDQRKLVKEGFAPLPAWQDAIRRYLEELKKWDK